MIERVPGVMESSVTSIRVERVAVTRHTGGMVEGTLRALLRVAGIAVEDFLAA